MSRRTMTAHLQGKIEEWNCMAEETKDPVRKEFCISMATSMEEDFDRYALYKIDTDGIILEEINFEGKVIFE